MANREYPDLPFVPPAAFGAGRPAPPRVIVIHYTAGSERSTSAEDGAAYDQRRTDGTSCHYFVDSNSVVQCVYTWDRANSALYTGNRIGIQYELCGTQQTRAQWLDPASDATLTNAARQAARDAVKYGIPVRKLSPQQVRAGERGFCGHADITLAYPEDGGDHMDPGDAFPWDVFLARAQAFMDGDEVALDQKEREWLSTCVEILGAMADGAEATWARPVKAQKQLNAIATGVQALAARPAATVTLTDAQLQTVIDGVAAKLASLIPTADRIAAASADEEAKRLGNG